MTPTTPDPRASADWARFALIRGAILVVSGVIALFRPDEAGLALGIALLLVVALELAGGPGLGSLAGAGRRDRRLLQIVAGTAAGIALIVSSEIGASIGARLMAVALAAFAGIDLWAASRTGRAGLRGFRTARAIVALAVAVVLFAIPTVALDILLFVAALGWVVIGAIDVVGVTWPPAVIRTRGVGPTGVIDIVESWLRVRDVGSERRRQILDAYDYDWDDRDRLTRFTILLVLAGIIASAGLISNSVASIIGAMIIAPLMGPIVGIALGIVTAMPARTVRSLVVAATGTFLTILIGVVLAAWLGTTPGVADNSEIVSRTSPTLIDLVVALAAGAAGAYAASNPKVADSLPGVAIAISLVPPLETAGILIALGEPAAAGGALLLFTTNFVSIVLAASVVFVLTGVAPISRLVTSAERTQGWFVSFLVAGLLLLIPLAVGGQQAFETSTNESAATTVVEDWLSTAPGFVVVDVSVSGHSVKVAVAGPGAGPDPSSLQSALDAALGGPVDLVLRVTPTSLYTTPAGSSPSAAP